MPAGKLHKIRHLVRFCGRNVSLLFVLTIPLSLLQGVNEILFGLGLMMFVSSYGLVPAAQLPRWFPTSADPFILLLALGLVRWGFTFASQFIGQSSYESFHGRVRRKIASAIDVRSAGATITVSEISNVFTNISPKSAAFIPSVLHVFGHGLVVAVTLLGMLRLSPRLTLIAALVTGVLGIPMFLTRKRFQSFSGIVYQNSGKFISRLTRDVRNLGFLNILGRTAEEARALVSLNWAILSAYMRYTFWLTANSSWPQFAAVCVIGTVVLFNDRSGSIAAGQLIAFVYLLSRVTNSMGEVIRNLGNVQFNQPFMGHLLRVMDRIDAGHGAPHSGHVKIGAQGVQTLEVRDLSVGRARPLLNNVSFSIRAGDFVCVSGESGKGKTTLLLTLIGLVRPLGGQILWNGVPLETLDLLDLQSRCAFSGADPFLLDASIRENVLFGNEHLHHTDADIREALTLAKCDFVEQLPKQLDFVLQEGGEGISAGQKQRLSIARAVLRRSDVLVLDEATANLDVETEAAILAGVREKLPRTLVLAVSHRESIARFATVRLAP